MKLRLTIIVAVFLIGNFALAAKLSKKTQSKISFEHIEPDPGPGGLYSGIYPVESLIVKMMKDGTPIGKHTLKGLDAEESIQLQLNIVTLSNFLDAGGEFSIKANPSAKDISRIVQKISNSKNLKTVKLLHKIQLDLYKKDLDRIFDKYKACKRDLHDRSRTTTRLNSPPPSSSVPARGGR